MLHSSHAGQIGSPVPEAPAEEDSVWMYIYRSTPESGHTVYAFYRKADIDTIEHAIQAVYDVVNNNSLVLTLPEYNGPFVTETGAEATPPSLVQSA